MYWNQSMRSAQEGEGKLPVTPQGSLRALHYLVTHLFLWPGYFKYFYLYLFYYDMSTFGLICVDIAFFWEQTFNLIIYFSLEFWKCYISISQILLLHSPPCLLIVLFDNYLYYEYPLNHFLRVFSYTVFNLEYTSPSEFISITSYLIFTISRFFNSLLLF